MTTAFFMGGGQQQNRYKQNGQNSCKGDKAIKSKMNKVPVFLGGRGLQHKSEEQNKHEQQPCGVPFISDSGTELCQAK